LPKSSLATHEKERSPLRIVLHGIDESRELLECEKVELLRRELEKLDTGDARPK